MNFFTLPLWQFFYREMPIYVCINAFFAFSLFGYLLECAVLSWEYKRPILNRGFVHGPFCIIYGVCAGIATFFLAGFAYNVVLLYVMSLLLATAAEWITGHVMLYLFGAFWWDYSKKPFNCKGMICLESSLAWGVLGVFYFRFLHRFILAQVGSIPEPFAKVLATGLLTYYLIDFSYCLYQRHTGKEEVDSQAGIYKVNE